MEKSSESGVHFVGFIMYMDGMKTVQIPMQPIEFRTALLVGHSTRQDTTLLWSQYYENRTRNPERRERTLSFPQR
jgi:hypothetical protein